MEKILQTKTYLKYISIPIIIFILYHLLVWTFFTSQIFDPKKGTGIGDLGRLSYQINLLENRELKYTLKKRFIFAEDFKTQKIDIITIGDSFSHGGGGGENPYYQDYLATLYNINILDIKPMPEYTSLEIALGLYNSGYLEKLKPKIVLIESVQRSVPYRFTKELEKNAHVSAPVFTSKQPIVSEQDISIINTANYKIPYYFIAYYFKKNAKNNVYKFKLNKKLFSGDNGNSTLILDDDIKTLNTFTKENILKVNRHFNYVSKKLKKLGIKLYFMPCPDKYDLYYDYFENNTYEKNQFFELIRPLKKDYYFVDTKKILSPLLKKGIKDVYWIDDTHWSSKASEAISNAKVFSENIKKTRD